MAGLPKVTDATFQETVAGGGLVLIDFSATWCGPCKKLHPLLEDVQAERPDVRIALVDIQEAPEAARTCGVMSVPQVHFFKEGRAVDKFIGLQSKARILELINKNL
ncbi:MAG: thioredoxin family protein [bacterium]|jgi:thioredoxin 1|nr:thioredoxin family protein [bacterium]